MNRLINRMIRQLNRITDKPTHSLNDLSIKSNCTQTDPLMNDLRIIHNPTHRSIANASDYSSKNRPTDHALKKASDVPPNQVHMHALKKASDIHP